MFLAPEFDIEDSLQARDDRQRPPGLAPEEHADRTLVDPAHLRDCADGQVAFVAHHLFEPNNDLLNETGLRGRSALEFAVGPGVSLAQVVSGRAVESEACVLAGLWPLALPCHRCRQ